MTHTFYALGLTLWAMLTPTGVGALTEHSQRTRILNEDSVVPNTGMRRPELLSYVIPEYTDSATKNQVSGVVSFLADFDIDGSFRILRQLHGLGFGLDESALAAVLQWRFQPAFQNGRRVRVLSEIDVVFDPEAQSQIINDIVQSFSSRGMRTQIKLPNGDVLVFKNGTFRGNFVEIDGLELQRGRAGGTNPQMTISGVR